MDKNKLTAVLVYKLEESGVTRESAIAEARSFVGSLSEADAVKLAALSDNDAMMSKIAASLKKKAETAHQPTVGGTEAAVTPKKEAPSADPVIKIEQPEEQVPRNATGEKEYGQAPSVRTQQPSRQEQPKAPQQQAPRRKAPEKPKAPAPQAKRPAREKPEKRIKRPDPNADYKKFYIIFGCTSPIWIFLLLCVVTLFMAVIGAFALAIVAIIAVLVAAVALGTTVSVVGIVYGATQLFTYAPIGLYEIGLGLKIGGWLMLGGIIAYNVAVRLLPFLIKKVLELFVFTAHKVVELYFYVKGACANL